MNTTENVVVLMEALTGKKVRVQGLNRRPELNGSRGWVLSYAPEQKRYAVKLQAGDSVLLRFENLEQIDVVKQPPLYDSLEIGDDGKAVVLGRTHMPVDSLSIFMERCLIEREKEGHKCATCGKKKPRIVCGGCRLAHWCNSECQRHAVEAGHGSICQAYCTIRLLREDPVLQEASKLFQTPHQSLGYDNARLHVQKLAVEGKLKGQTIEALFKIVMAIVQFPASSERATCTPGTKLPAPKTQTERIQLVGNRTPVKGKLTFCATAHKSTKYQALSKKDLKAKHPLPCGRSPSGGLTLGVTADVSHETVYASLKDLTIRSNQQMLCSRGCNNHESPHGGKAIVSNVFWSFCLDRVCNDTDAPGSVAHCNLCGLCGNYMYSHMVCCNDCSYGSKMNIMPCQNCHDLVLAHDGVVFVPLRKCITELTGSVAAMFACRCGNGNENWMDGSTSTSRKPLIGHFGDSNEETTQAERTGLPFGDDLRDWSEEYAKDLWESAEVNPKDRVVLIDQVLQETNFDRESYDEMLTRLKISSASPLLEAAKEMKGYERSRVGFFVGRLMAQYDGSNHRRDQSFEEWLVSEREKAAAVAKDEYKALRKAGVAVDKKSYKKAVADRCLCCGEKPTEFKQLRVCSRCQTAYYCDEECQRKHWPTHKPSCAKTTKGKAPT